MDSLIFVCGESPASHCRCYALSDLGIRPLPNLSFETPSQHCNARIIPVLDIEHPDEDFVLAVSQYRDYEPTEPEATISLFHLNRSAYSSTSVIYRRPSLKLVGLSGSIAGLVSMGPPAFNNTEFPRIVGGDSNGSVLVFDSKTGRVLHTTKTGPSVTRCMARFGNCEVFAAGMLFERRSSFHRYIPVVSRMDVNRGTTITHLFHSPGFDTRVLSVAVSEEAGLLYSAGSQDINLWSCDTNTCVQKTRVGACYSLLCPSEFQILVGTVRGSIRLFDCRRSLEKDIWESSHSQKSRMDTRGMDLVYRNGKMSIVCIGHFLDQIDPTNGKILHRSSAFGDGDCFLDCCVVGNGQTQFQIEQGEEMNRRLEFAEGCGSLFCSIRIRLKETSEKKLRVTKALLQVQG